MNGKNRWTMSPDLERRDCEDNRGSDAERRRDTRDIRQIQSASILDHGEEIKEGRLVRVAPGAHRGAAGSIVSVTVKVGVDRCVFVIGARMDVAERREGQSRQRDNDQAVNTDPPNHRMIVPSGRRIVKCGGEDARCRWPRWPFRHGGAVPFQKRWED